LAIFLVNAKNNQSDLAASGLSSYSFGRDSL